MTINERIALIISTLKLNQNSFSVAIGVNPTIIHNIVKGRNAPSYDILNKIALSFDDINMNWLIVEKGQILNPGSDFAISHVQESEVKYRPTIKLCEKCRMKDVLIDSLNREINTLTQYNTLLKSK